MMYDSIIDSIIDAYEGDDIWTYGDEVRTTINDCEDMDIMTYIRERQNWI